MSAQLRVLTGAFIGETFTLVDAPITIGRESDNMICLDEDSVSRHHAVLTTVTGEHVLNDVNSTNGCWVNGVAVTNAALHNGDVIRIGGFEMRYEAEPARPAAVSIRNESVQNPVAAPVQIADVSPAKREIGGARIPPRIVTGSPPLPAKEAPSPALKSERSWQWPQIRQPQVSSKPSLLPPLAQVQRQSEPPISVRFEVSYSTGGDRFIKAAQKLVERYEPSASFVPFMSYWPTYDAMTNAQSKWYFHWRGCVRNCNYPDTDLSYVFVHAYELINSVGVKNASDGYNQLHKLWLNYRERISKLDNYLVDWISDYAIVNNCDLDPLEVYHEAFAHKAFVLRPDILLRRYEDNSFAKIPISLIQAVSDYRFQRSKFYLQGNQDLFNECLTKVLCQVDSYLRGKFGKGILDSHRPPAPQPISRRPFCSAAYAGGVKFITVAKVFPYSTHHPLRAFVTTIIKHTENLLRENRRFRGKLRGYELDSEIAGLIRQCVQEIAVPPAVRKRIEVDMTKIPDLTRASDELREILLEGAQGQDDGVNESPAPLSGDTPIQRPEGTPVHLLTDLNEVNRLLVRTTAEERQLLNAMRERKWQCDDSVLTELLPGVLIERAVDRINEVSLRFIGDILLSSGDGKIIVTDDYRDELEFLLTRKADSPSQSLPLSKTFEDLPAEWGSFMSRLRANQVQTLRVIATNGQSRDEIKNLAAVAGIMPEALIDSINELAHETIGDIIIDTNSMPPVIEEEDFEMVQKALTLIA